MYSEFIYIYVYCLKHIEIRISRSKNMNYFHIKGNLVLKFRMTDILYNYLSRKY